MSGPRVVITLTVRQGDLADAEWAIARKLLRERRQLGADGFMAATLPGERRHEVAVTAEARTEV